MVSKEFDAEQSHPLELKRHVCTAFGSRRGGAMKKKNGFRIIIAETRGHVLSP
jgi:hypothetical protein